MNLAADPPIPDNEPQHGVDGRHRPPNGTRIRPTPHPSRGGTAYSVDLREQVVCRNDLNQPMTTQEITELRAERKYPSITTCKRWIKQNQEINHVRPKRRTGNKYATREVQGEQLVQLALFRCIKSKSTIDECRAYLHNRYPHIPPYSHSQIHRAEVLLNLRRKAATTTADLAYLPINLQKRDMYWEFEYPYGMVGVDTRDILDLDECGIMVETTNRNFGKVASILRCDDNGPFNRNAKLNLLLCVSADEDAPITFHETWVGEGTTLWRFYNYMLRLIEHLATFYPGRSFCFTMDNLNVHRNQLVENIILDAGHRVVYRAPYWSVDGAIEYVFNTIHTKLQQRYQQISTMDELVNRVNLIIGEFETFKKYFVHVGFPDY